MNVVLPQYDDRIVVTTPAGSREEHLGTRSTYLYQLEALRAPLRDGAPLPIDVDDAVATAELIDDVYRAAGFAPRPTSDHIGLHATSRGLHADRRRLPR